MKQKLTKILSSNNVTFEVRNNLDYVLQTIPELKSMIGFEHNHPHHHLDVWEHTLKVINNLNSSDLELNMAALLHDIGKPFSFQEGDIRHFQGHAQVSCEMTKKILMRLGYDNLFVTRISYLVLMHDTIIDTNSINEDKELLLKRLELQYADAKAHHPDKVEKRIKILDGIKAKLLF